VNKLWLYPTLFLSLLIGTATAQAFDSSGLADAVCIEFHLSGVKVTSAKAISAHRTDYYLSATGFAGKAGCPSAIYGPYPVTVAASWDASTGKATEQISHGSPSSPTFIATHTQATCPKDPWMYAVTCTLDSQSHTHPGSDMSYFSFTGPFPITANLLTGAQRKLLAATAAPDPDFTLAPTTPPVIVSPGPDAIVRNGAPVMVQIKRPLDGNDKWYAAHPVQFEVQFQVHQEARVSAPGGMTGKALGMAWANLPATALIGTTTMSTAPITVPATTFAARGPGGAGDWQSWHIRTRLIDPGASRPWSSWQTFFVVVPTTFTKMPGPDKPFSAFDKPTAAPTPPAPASKAIVPSPMARPTMPPAIVPQPVVPAAPAKSTTPASPTPLQKGVPPQPQQQLQLQQQKQ